jgi:hypothetical protein
MAHVQRAGHVRRRDRDRVVLLGGPLGFWGEQLGRLPARKDPRLRVCGVVAGAGLEVGVSHRGARV